MRFLPQNHHTRLDDWAGELLPGFNAKGGAAGVGRAVNNTVVYSVLLFISANYFPTSALWGGDEGSGVFGVLGRFPALFAEISSRLGVKAAPQPDRSWRKPM